MRERDARAIEHVVRRVDRCRRTIRVAEPFHDRVDEIAVSTRRRPGVVPAMAELDDELGAGERDTTRVDTGPVQVDLGEQLRGVVTGLRTEHGDRMTVDDGCGLTVKSDEPVSVT